MIASLFIAAMLSNAGAASRCLSQTKCDVMTLSVIGGNLQTASVRVGVANKCKQSIGFTMRVKVYSADGFELGSDNEDAIAKPSSTGAHSTRVMFVAQIEAKKCSAVFEDIEE